MDGGSLNLRNDEVFDKLDSAPRKDVNKLIQLQKETNANNIAKQRRDSLNAIEESLFKLDIFEEAAAEYKTGRENEDKKTENKNELFKSIVNNLSSDNDSFLKKIETLYNILFKSYKSELIIRKKLGNYDGSINDVDEYVKNRILGRIIFNIEYFRNFTKEYEKYDFEDVINKIKKIPESSMSQEQDKIRENVEKLLNRDNDTNYTDAEINELIKLITGEKSGGGFKNITITPSVFKRNKEEGDFQYMIAEDIKNQRKNRLFIFNDNHSQHKTAEQGKNNGVIRNYNNYNKNKKYRANDCLEDLNLDKDELVRSAGISTGSGIEDDIDENGYKKESNWKKIIDDEFKEIEDLLKKREYNTLVYSADSNKQSSNGKKLLGAKIFSPDKEVLEYITDKIYTLQHIKIDEKKEVTKQIVEVIPSGTTLLQKPVKITDENVKLTLEGEGGGEGEEEEDASNGTRLIEKLTLEEEGEEEEGGEEGGDGEGDGEKKEEEDSYNNIQLIQEFSSDPNIVNIPHSLLVLPDAGRGIVRGSTGNTPKQPTDPPVPNSSSETNNDEIENKNTSNNTQLTQEIENIITKHQKRLNSINFDATSYIKKGVKLIMLILHRLGLTKNGKELKGGGGSPEKTTESNLLEYVKRTGENAILVLTKDTGITTSVAKEAIINLILTQQYLFRNLTNKVNFYVLEVFYGIIYGTLLNYDLILKEENKYIIERVENLSQVYSIINDIIYDQTYRTLKQLYNKKYPGYRNIFRIDSLYNDVFRRSETNKTEKGSFTEENEYSLRDLVILKINNGAVDIKEFQKLLNIMYKNNKYQDLYKFLHEVSNIYNLGKEIKILSEAGYNDVVKTKTDKLKQQIEKAKKDLKELELKTPTDPLLLLTKLEPQLDALLPPDIEKTFPEHLKKNLENKLTELHDSLKKVKTTAKEIIGNPETKSSSSVDNSKDTATTLDANAAGIENKTDNDLHKVIAAILDLPPEDSTQIKDKFSGLFSTYIEKNKKMGGTNINPINIKTPVSGYDEPTPNKKKCDSSIVEPMTRITEQLDKKLGGSLEEDYEKIKIKKEELKAKLENPTVDDDITESVSDNAKRKLNKVKNNIKQFFNTKENVEEDIPKVLDEEYLDELKNFNINSVKTQSYKELRKNLYRIKNNEYFEDIKITNEDIYTFIATTYVLRVISLYITMWFIQIEIVKDVESVIVSYILTYILLFILIYTFVNLSDNQLDTSKSFLYYFYSRVNFSYTRFIVHLGLLLLLIIIPFVIRTIDKESASYKHISDTEKRYLYTFITNMSTIVWVILSIIAFFFK